MENGTFAPQEQMYHFSYFQKSYISKASKGACVEKMVKAPITTKVVCFVICCYVLEASSKTSVDPDQTASVGAV